MKRALVHPDQIWSWYPRVVVSEDLIARLQETGWEGIPPVPVFRIPDERRVFDYIIMDGNTRKNTASHMDILIPAAIYNIGEEVDLEKHGLAPFRAAKSPKLYLTELFMYLTRDSRS